MSYSLQFGPEVADDIEKACGWYQDRSEGLPQQFLNELQDLLHRISETPEIYAAGDRDVRSARLHRFPYVVHYRICGTAS